MPKYVELINGRVQFIGIADSIPPSMGNIRIMDVTYYTGSLAASMRLENGEFVDDNSPIVVTTPEDLIRLKNDLQYKINIEAGRIRSLLVTTSPGQEMTYIEKGLETQRYFADPAPDPANYPWLRREAAATNMTVLEVAQLVAYTSQVWTEAGSLIEAARRGGIVTVTAATTAEEAYTAFAAIQWPSF